MAFRKVLLIMDSGEAINNVLRFSLKNIIVPGDLCVAFFHQYLHAINFTSLFKAKQLLHLEYSYREIIEKIAQNIELPVEEKESLIEIFSEQKIQPVLYFDEVEFLKNIHDETLFADLALCSTKAVQKMILCGNNGIETITQNFNCPTLIVPDSVTEIENIFLVFNGHPSSMKTIKEFSYVLSHLYQNKNVTILSATGNSANDAIADRLLMQYAKLHIPNVAYMKIIGNDGQSILNFTAKNKGVLVATGNNSIAQEGIIKQETKNHKSDWDTLPVFIGKN